MPDHSTLGPCIGFGRTAHIYAWDNGRVIKVFHNWIGADAIWYEARVGEQLYAAGLPVPRVHEVTEVDQRLGIVYERIEGELLAHLLQRRPWRAGYAGRLMADLHALIHSVKLENLPSLRCLLREAITTAPGTLPESSRQQALAVLDALPEDNTVCHGDFHPENIILSGDRTIVIDWIAAGRGLPALDVMRTGLLMTIGMSPDPLPTLLRPIERLVRTLMMNAYHKRYFHRTGLTRDDLHTVALPVVTARFAEPIPEELPARLRMLKRLDTAARGR